MNGTLVSSWANITYLTGFSGFSPTERECFLLLTQKKNYLITDGRYIDALKEKAKGFELIGIGAGRFISEDNLKILKKLNTLAIEEDNLTVSELKKLRKHIKKIENADLSNLRAIKRADEIKKIQKACNIGDKTFDNVLGSFSEGISEIEISNKIQTLIKFQGADISFPPIVAFGRNSAFPHHQSGRNKLGRNQIILLDFGVKFQDYCSDMTRTIFFGKASKEFKKMYQTVLTAQKAALDSLSNRKTNFLGKDIDKIARDYIIKNGFASIPHSLGHGIGLEVHEAPSISPYSEDEIKPGMVFSIEPGIYDPNIGGVRIEDLVMIEQKGAELISHGRSEIIEL